MMYKKNDNSILNHEDSEDCSICKELRDSLSKFFAMLDSVRKKPADEWLTVGQVATELKISKSIVYRIIRNGELEAVNIVDRSSTKNYENQKTFTLKGHYRIKKASLDSYLEKKKVHPSSEKTRYRTNRHFPKVKNHLGL